jgi:phosphoglycerate kinase
MAEYYSKKKTIKDLDLAGKKVLMRVDFNVPLDKKTRAVTDATRIDAALPTIKYILKQGGKLILMSHLGRPKGDFKDELRMDVVAKELETRLGQPVGYSRDCCGSAVREAVANLEEGQVHLLENVRFHPEEEKNDKDFAKTLASLGEVYVNDAFGTAHRAHASTEGIAQFLPSAAGFLMEKELKFLGDHINKPKRPFLAIIGGAKISTKIGVLEALIDKVDTLIIGGAMAYTFYLAMGLKTGNSLVEKDKVNMAKNLLDQAKKKGKDVILPEDNIIVENVAAGSPTKTVGRDEIVDGWEGVDVGPKTIATIKEKIGQAETIFWNGPLGIFEIVDFANGTMEIAHAVAAAKATTIVGGGDSVAAVNIAQVADKISHISTGGGASLEFIEGKELPGVAALSDK